MKWIKNKVIKWIREDWDDEYKKREETRISLRADDNRPEKDPILNFRLYSAENGKVLEFNHYDRVKDRHQTSLYIIGKEEDIAEKVSKCVSLELMK